MAVRRSAKSNLLAWFRGVAAEAQTLMEEGPRRSTSPEARMTLILRFETRNGPRSVVVPAIPLAMASDIADEMIKAGHFAEFVDHFAPQPVAERLKHCGREAERKNRAGHPYRSIAA